MPYSDPEKEREWNREYKRRKRAENPERHREYQRRWFAENPEKKREYDRRRYVNTAEQQRENSRIYHAKNPDKVRESNRRWRAKNAEKQREYLKRWCAENLERLREVQRRWQKKNPEKVKIYDHRRRAREANVIGDFTAEQFKALCAHFKHHCLKCGRPRKVGPDHVIPISWADRPEYKGVALNDIDNIQPLCKQCNSSKCDSHVDYRTQPHQHCINPPMVEDYLA